MTAGTVGVKVNSMDVVHVLHSREHDRKGDG
jgi:hypothetical protein